MIVHGVGRNGREARRGWEAPRVVLYGALYMDICSLVIMCCCRKESYRDDKISWRRHIKIHRVLGVASRLASYHCWPSLHRTNLLVRMVHATYLQDDTAGKDPAIRLKALFTKKPLV